MSFTRILTTLAHLYNVINWLKMQSQCVRTVKHCLLRNALYGRYISLFAAQQLFGSLGIHIQANRVDCR